jgi:hypothetical protein
VTNCPVMILLNERVPITLLCDLISLADPDSEAINRAERPDRDPIWLEVAEHTKTVEADAAADAAANPGSAQTAC